MMQLPSSLDPRTLPGYQPTLVSAGGPMSLGSMPTMIFVPGSPTSKSAKKKSAPKTKRAKKAAPKSSKRAKKAAPKSSKRAKAPKSSKRAKAPKSSKRAKAPKSSKRAKTKNFVVSFELNGVDSLTMVRAANARAAEKRVSDVLPSAKKTTASPAVPAVKSQKKR